MLPWSPGFPQQHSSRYLGAWTAAYAAVTLRPLHSAKMLQKDEDLEPAIRGVQLPSCVLFKKASFRKTGFMISYLLDGFLGAG